MSISLILKLIYLKGFATSDRYVGNTSDVDGKLDGYIPPTCPVSTE